MGDSQDQGCRGSVSPIVLHRHPARYDVRCLQLSSRQPHHELCGEHRHSRPEYSARGMHAHLPTYLPTYLLYAYPPYSPYAINIFVCMYVCMSQAYLWRYMRPQPTVQSKLLVRTYK